ncbi:hypothetical protein [Luteolibacter luteus]|uniref:TIGR02588 family protein n=1 Tax=Luteolibacter luteus TaxID=2728835 RepID=A0A858RK96_9BACT|nr:hypothetical protein [Luteolibacter luteus]QJE97357.1 hypothetical protein HHL09_16705 [Luteolibacter luteus]
MNQNRNTDQPSEGKNALEWTVFTFSTLLVGAIIVLLGVDTLRWKEGPARLEIVKGDAKTEDGQLRVPIHIINRGETVAVNVTVEVTDTSSAQGKNATVNFDFVPRGAMREGRAIFPPDQDPAKLEARISGYEVP